MTLVTIFMTFGGKKGRCGIPFYIKMAVGLIYLFVSSSYSTCTRRTPSGHLTLHNYEYRTAILVVHY